LKIAVPILLGEFQVDNAAASGTGRYPNSGPVTA
jgi:hypothetical protein